MKTRPAPSLEAQQAVLERIERLEAEKARLHAESLAARAELAELWESERNGFAEMELAGTALVGQFRAARELDDGRRAVECFPRLQELLAEGVVFVPTAELLLQATRRCTPEVQMAVDARISSLLVGRNVTDCRVLVRSTVLAVEAELDPQLTRDRLDAARQSADVWVRPGDDGLTSIGAVLEAVAGRRWAVDFEALVKAQKTLDLRLGIERTLPELRAEVFANLPGLVLELARAARDGRLAELAEVAALDPDTAAELSELAEQALADVPDADVMTGEIRVEEDPFDLARMTALDPYTDLPFNDAEPAFPDLPEPPPSAAAAQDAALSSPLSRRASSTDRQLDLFLLRCLQMPLPAPVVVALHLPVATALDLTDAPGILEGHGPLDARRVRELLPSAGLREVYVDESTGVPLGATRPEQPRDGQHRPSELLRRIRAVTLTDRLEPQHDPSARLAELVKLRDVRCSGPGCTMPACRCHLDHEVEHPLGPTAEWNLQDKSPRCHGAKHHGWTAVRQPDGRTVWTSPPGRAYTSYPQWQPPPTARRKVQFHLPPEGVAIEIELGGD